MQIGSFDLDKKCLIIAELSANHGGSIDVALQTIRAAKEAGADAIKLQTFTPDTITLNSDKSYFQIDHGTAWDGRNLYNLYEEAHTPWEWHQALFDEAHKQGLIIFSSPFDKTAVDFLEGFDVPAYKIASFEIQDIPLISYAASKGKPMIMSTGIATMEDIELAVQACRDQGNENIMLLKCTSSYPAPLELANLRTGVDFKERFKVDMGLSDHTLGNTAPVVAVSLGARLVEKHFILDKSLGGPDVGFSLDPEEFKSMVNAIRDTEKALGAVTYQLSEKVEKNRKFARSLFIAENIKAGEVFTEENIRSVRPGYGLHPKYLTQVLGQKATKDLEMGEPLQGSDITGFEQ